MASDFLKQFMDMMRHPEKLADIVATTGWLKESVQLQQAGVYRELASLLEPELRHAEKILDVCSGSCPIECALDASGGLRGKNIVAVEANDVTVERAQAALVTRGQSARIVPKEATVPARDTVTIINAALADCHDTITAMLPGKADITLFTLAGSSSKLAETETREVHPAYMQSEGRRQLANMIVDGFEAAAMHTREGGLLLRADRIQSPMGHISNATVQQMRHRIGALTKPYWELEQSHRLDSFAPPREGETTDRILAHRLHRTDKTFDPDFYAAMRKHLPVLYYA